MSTLVNTPENSAQRLYVLVRDDLKKSHKAVQAGHAVAEWCLEIGWGSSIWENGTLVYLDINKEDLNYWKYVLQENDLSFIEYGEPYHGKEPTAIAIACDGRHFKDLNLAEF